MTVAHDAFQVNGPQIIHENIDGELVLINLRKGSYYSTDPIGAQVWDLLVAGCRVKEMQERIQARYDGDPAEVAMAIAAFLDDLEREDLIIKTESPLGNGSPPPETPSERTRFQAPVLNKYRDMEDMLMLDPIHEVEESGWPAPKPAEIRNPPEPRTSE